MTIYIEQVLLDNLIINSLIIITTLKLNRIKIVWWKVLLSAFIGSVFALFLPIIVLPSTLLMMIKLILGFSMVLLLLDYVKKTRFKKIFILYVSFIIITFVYGGACYGILLILNAEIIANSIFSYVYNIPISLIVLICFVVFYLLIQSFKYFYQKRSVVSSLYEVKLHLNGRVETFMAFYDSGNLLKTCDGRSVVMATYEVARKIFSTENFIKLIAGNLLGDEQIYIGSIGSYKTKIEIFMLEKIEIYFSNKWNIYLNVPMGLAHRNFSKTNDYCLLIGSEYLTV